MGSREWCYGSCSFCPAHSKVRDFPPQACQVHCPPPPTPQAVFPPLFFFLFFPLLPTTVASNPPSGCGRVRQVTSPQLHRHVVPARLVPPFSNCHVAGNQVNSLFHLKKEKERKNERKSKRARGADREGSPPKIYSSYVHYFCCSPPPSRASRSPLLVSCLPAGRIDPLKDTENLEEGSGTSTQSIKSVRPSPFCPRQTVCVIRGCSVECVNFREEKS